MAARAGLSPRVADPDAGASEPPCVDVHIVLLDDSLLLDWAGPAEALRTANRLRTERGLPPAFALHFRGPQARTRSSVGATVADLQPLPDLRAARRPQWVMLVGQTGARMALDSAPARTVLHWLAGLAPLLAPERVELICVCAGAVIAGRAGLLDGRTVTTHHAHLDELRALAPRARVLDNRVFVPDSPVASSAGVTTGIDLTLHRIAARLGPVLAVAVARALVVALRRGPQDPELSPFLQHRQHLHPVLHRVQDAVGRHPQDDWTVARMAAIGHTSARHLGRLFQAHAGLAPLAWLQQLRLAVARAALDSGHGVSRAAALAGFSSDGQLRRAWHRHGLDGLPSDRGEARARTLPTAG